MAAASLGAALQTRDRNGNAVLIDHEDEATVTRARNINRHPCSSCRRARVRVSEIFIHAHEMTPDAFGITVQHGRAVLAKFVRALHKAW